MLHIGSTLGQLEGIPLPGVQEYMRNAKSVQEIIDMPYPAKDLAEVSAAPGTHCLVVLVLLSNP